MDFDQASAVVFGAIIAAGAGLTGAVLTSWRQAKLDERKWLREREAEALAETGEARRDITKTLASAAHSMMWSTFKALNTERIDAQELHAYEQEFHEAVSSLVGSQMHIALLDTRLYERVTPLVSETIALGGDTLVALTSAVEGSRDDNALLDCNRQALALIKRLPEET